VKPYYDEDGITIYHGDCLEVMAEFAPKSIGACLTDPPYGVGVLYGSKTDDRRKDYWDWMRRVVYEMVRVSEVTAFTHRVAALGELDQWDWVGCWNKPWSSGARVGNSCLLPHWEPIFMYGVHAMGTKSDYTSDVFTFSPEKAPTGGQRGRESWAKTEGQVDHPTPKPLALYVSLILSLGQAADVILDPFMGSGTTLRAAKDLGRRAIGIDNEERFCELTAKRLGQGVLNLV
jgi:DNA modification methylase